MITSEHIVLKGLADSLTKNVACNQNQHVRLTSLAHCVKVLKGRIYNGQKPVSKIFNFSLTAT